MHHRIIDFLLGGLCEYEPERHSVRKVEGYGGGKFIRRFLEIT